MLNEAGLAAGDAKRYSSGGAGRGQSAWLYNGTSTIDISLTDTEHTGANGFRSSSSFGMNEAGQVTGLAGRYDDSTGNILGLTTWQYNGLDNVNIGLIDTEPTGMDGYRESRPEAFNETGHVSGYAVRYDTTTGASLGDSAWLYNGASTVNIGLVDSGHTRDDGRRVSRTLGVNESGQVTGYAFRYNNSTGDDLGESAWLYNGASTVNIGMADTEHTRADGYRYSAALI